MYKKNPILKRVDSQLESLKKKFPQTDINGYRNIWIVKPASLSRGRGIEVFNNLVEILDHTASHETQWIV